ncbi:MAG: hypothetical protein LBE92_18215 [Chryseobacterium sp.]|jgi:hypothetical protein|uniref:hypothetical protein n=1 Tax=Chryseobacterium sp. TaxID=1871047 RepID=UPI002835267B|nr:hypothetical protein [Chryseobacterium sp.]MDR2238062.1 hypothetical protein [Chryseobacterium sp.]
MKKIFFASVVALSFIACGENRRDHPPAVANAVDNAESSVSGSLKSSYRSDDMIDQIYSELLKTDKNLQALDDRLTKIYQESAKVLGSYEPVLRKSESFYQDARQKAVSIKDTLLKKEVEQQIKISADQYDLKIRNIKELIKKINTNSEIMTDQYIALKIRKTLPEIQKYQNAHPLKTDSLEHFIRKQENLLNQLKNMK